MNTGKARKLRRKIYGDMSQKAERHYVRVGTTIMNAADSLRGLYQKAKRGTMALAMLLIMILATGCTVKLNGEASMMKQWDRPAESTATSTVDTSANARVVPLPSQVVVPDTGVKVQTQEPVRVK